jgi:hypothetical protein
MNGLTLLTITILALIAVSLKMRLNKERRNCNDWRNIAIQMAEYSNKEGK